MVFLTTTAPGEYDQLATPLASEIKTSPAEAPVGIVKVPFNVVAPATVNAPPKAVAPVPTVNVFVPLTEVFPFNVVVPPIVVLPVTPRVPPRVVLPVTAKVLDKEVAPVTPKVPLKVAFPVTPKVLDKVVAPVTPNVPPRVVAPVPTVKVFDPLTEVLPFNVVAPVTANVPPKAVAPVPTVNVLDPLTAVFPLNVLAPATVCAVVKSTKFCEDDPVPPLAIGKIPVTPDVKGNPVALVNTAADGVPRLGVTKVGLVAKTKAPVPVSSVTAAIKFALDGVANAVATPVPNPLTPEEIGKPVALVKTAADGVPKAGVTKVGLVAKTKVPEPVSSEIFPANSAEVVSAKALILLVV